MPRDNCDPCCDPIGNARSVDSYRTAELQILCNILTALSEGAAGCCSTFSAAFPAQGIAAGASDGVNMKPLLVDGSGFLKVNVAAGGGAGGTSSNFTAAFPAAGTASGFSDGTNMQGARVYDVDSTGATEYVQGANLRISQAGASIEAKGQQTMANSIPVAIASNQSALSVTLAANQSVNVAQIAGNTTLTGNGVTGTGSQRVTIASDNTAFNVIAAGDVASDGVDSGNPVKVGAQARTTNPTAVSDADRVNLMADKVGKLVTTPSAPRQLVSSQTTTITASTSETTIITAGGASVFLDLTVLTISNTSATGVRVDLRDVTAGSVIASLYIPPTDIRGIVFHVPLSQTTANSAWTLQSSASVTDLRVFAQFIKNV